MQKIPDDYIRYLFWLYFGNIWGVYIIGIIMGIVKANKEEDPELPVVGGIAKSIFGKKIEE